MSDSGRTNDCWYCGGDHGPAADEIAEEIAECRRGMKAEIERLRQQVRELEDMNTALANRVAAQSEILSRNADRVPDESKAAVIKAAEAVHKLSGNIADTLVGFRLPGDLLTQRGTLLHQLLDAALVLRNFALAHAAFQPIATAPKDRRVLLLVPGWAEGPLIVCGQWWEETPISRPQWKYDGQSFTDCRCLPPTHWAELPEIPK